MTDARTTQIALEEWAGGAAQARTTVIAVEQWGSLAVSAGQAIVTQIAMEEWARIMSAQQASAAILLVGM